MPSKYNVQDLAVQNPQNLLREWHRERSLRVAKTLCYSGLTLSLIGTIADYFWSPFSVFITDVLLVMGCLLSIYWLRQPQRPLYYWWPMLWSFWISCLPSLWNTGGLTSPFFAIDIAAFYVLSSVLDENNHSRFYMWFALLHIPVFYILELFSPLAHSNTLSLELTAVITGITFGAIIFCIRAMLNSERGIALDFAEHFRNMMTTEKALIKSDAQLREAQSIARIGHWEWNVEDNIISWSDELFEIFDVDKETFDPSFEAYMNRMSPEMREKILPIINNSSTTGGDFSFENRMETRHGTRYIFSKGRVLKNSEGKTIKMWGMCQDITDRKTIESELRDAHMDLEKRVRDRTMELAKSLAREKEAKALAEHASQAKMQFLANMSHEIRTPMNSILGFAELLSQGEQSPEEAQDYIRRIRTNGAQLLHLIDDILDLSKFEAGQIPIHKITFNLKSVIDDVVQSFQPALENRGLELDLKYHGECLGQYISDAHRIQQVLINLLSNSIKFSESGTISVDVHCQPLDDDNKLLFAVDVKDSGIGISVENQKKLFQPFSQGDSSVARRFGGTGLGLAISKRICEALGGSMELVSSAVNKGCHFHFQIPLEPVQKESLTSSETKLAPTHNQDSFGLKGKHILLAEDAKDNAILICHYLRAVGVHIDVASDGLQAVNMAKTNDYDGILMDIQMPGMDGLEATRILRSEGYTQPIIALTAHALPSEMERSLEAGCTQHLTKPIKKADLIDALNAHISPEPTPPEKLLPTPS